MKKLLILSLVFAIILVFVLVPAAYGTISFASSSCTVYEGETCTGQISSDTDSTAWTGYLGNLEERISSVWPIDPDCCQANYGLSGYWTLKCGDVPFPPTCPTSGVQFEFEVYTLIGDAGEVFYVYLYASDWSTLLGTMTVTVTGPQTIYVDWDGSADYTTIQAGINAAVSGYDTVVVAEGTYNENITFGGKNITIMSSDPDDPVVVAATIIDGGDVDSTVTFGGSEDSSCMLTGFTITGGSSVSTGGGIAGGGSGAAISKCVIKGNSGQNGGGLADCDGAISNCLVYDNTSTLAGGATHDCDGDIVNCTIANNTAGQDAGGMYGCDGTVTNCIIWGNNLAEVAGGSTPTYCCIQGWSGGGEGNISINPEFVNAGAEDYHLPPWSYCTDAGTNSPAGGLPATDLEGMIRPIDGDNDGQATADMGCYESLASEEPVIWLEAAGEVLIVRNSGGGTLNWNISAGCSWVLPDPNSGSSTGEPNEVNFYLDTSGLNNGHHECMLTISDPCALNSPRYVILGLDIARPGDFDEDGEVNCDDLRVLALAYMSKSGDGNWNPDCDISDPNDEVIDGRDFGVFSMYWDGCGDPPP